MALQRDEGGSRTHTAAITRGVTYVIEAVENAPDGPRLRTPDGTQIQRKLGPLVDTHMATLMFSEVMPRLDGALRSRADRALKVVINKVQQSQKADGSFDANGWAPVLSTALAAQGLNNVANRGLGDVDKDVLERSDRYQRSVAAPPTGGFDASAGAGVELYAVATSLRGNSQVASRSGAAAAPKATREYAEQAEKKAAQAVTSDASGRLMAGFGSVGGEEMLSYMMISDAMAEKGGEDWTNWQNKVGTFLAKAQNQDGSWVGHHCITSQAFATAGGLMTLAAGS